MSGYFRSPWYYQDSGFTALGSGPPQRSAPRDWIVWHFTHLTNLAKIATCGNANAATDLVRFTRTVEGLGNFVDFDLLCPRMWSNTPDDQHRQSRRAAELLVLDQVPIEMITHVVAKVGKKLDAA